MVIKEIPLCQSQESLKWNNCGVLHGSGAWHWCNVKSIHFQKSEEKGGQNGISHTMT